jgi:hypothetical protein
LAEEISCPGLFNHPAKAKIPSSTGIATLRYCDIATLRHCDIATLRHCHRDHLHQQPHEQTFHVGEPGYHPKNFADIRSLLGVWKARDDLNEDWDRRHQLSRVAMHEALAHRIPVTFEAQKQDDERESGQKAARRRGESTSGNATCALMKGGPIFSPQNSLA